MILPILAVLSGSAAAGMRIALPLLLIGLLQRESLWSRVPLLSNLDPQVVVGVLAAWSFVEIFASKNLLGQRVLRAIQLVFSPVVGGLMGVTLARLAAVDDNILWIFGGVGGLLALVIQLVLYGWLFRRGRIPLWVIFMEDFLCICLVFFSIKAPNQGGIIALFILWLVIRIVKEWQKWYREGKRLGVKKPD